MRFWAYALLAVETVRRAKARALLSMLGVATGVVAIVMLVSVSGAARAYVEQQFASLGLDLIRVVPGRSERGIPIVGAAARPITAEDVEALRRRLPVGAIVSGMVTSQTTVQRDARSRGVVAVGGDDGWAGLMRIGVSNGSFFTADDVRLRRRVCVLGSLAAAKLFDDEDPVGQWVDIFGARFRVIGIYEPKGMAGALDLDDIATLPVSVVIDGFGLSGVNEVLLRPPPSLTNAEMAADIYDILDARRRERDYTLVEPDDILRVVHGVLDALAIVVVGIGAISLLVGGMGIANTMLLSVKERTREIGIRRAVGATAREVLVQFLCEAVVISAGGGVLGLAFSGGVIVIVRLAAGVPLGASPWVALLAILFSGTVGVVAGLAPARAASRLSPLEAVRS